MNTERMARALLWNIHETTPGGIRREQFVRRKHPLKTAIALFPFIAAAALWLFAIATRHG